MKLRLQTEHGPFAGAVELAEEDRRIRLVLDATGGFTGQINSQASRRSGFELIQATVIDSSPSAQAVQVLKGSQSIPKNGQWQFKNLGAMSWQNDLSDGGSFKVTIVVELANEAEVDGILAKLSALNYPVADFHKHLGKAAALVLGPGLEGKPSPFDPEVVTWTKEAADDILTRIRDNPDTSRASFMDKISVQLAGAPRATVLLAAELLYLQSLPIVNVGPAAKRLRVEGVLALTANPPAIPDELAAGWDGIGAFHGGTSFNTRLPFHLVWLAEFVKDWCAADEKQRRRSTYDPAVFGAFAEGVGLNSEQAIRSSLCFLAFPGYFPPIVSLEHRRLLRDALASNLLGKTRGDSELEVIADIFDMDRTVQPDVEKGIDWYHEPWRSQWQTGPATGERRAWRVRTKQQPTIQDWIEQGYVSLPGRHLGTVEGGSDQRVVREAVQGGYEHLNYVQQMELTSAYYAFISRMQVEDVILVRSSETAHVGVITGELKYDESGGDRLTRTVQWEVRELNARGLPEPLPALMDKQGEVVDFTEGLEALLSLIPGEDEVVYDDSGDGESEPKPVLREVRLPAVTESLASGLHMPTAPLQEIVDLLGERRQIVLYGPPGTGKTYVAMELAKHLTSDEANAQLVQFHPSYAYEDFFEGYRPTETEQGQATFRIEPGPLRRIASSAADNPTEPHVLIIDEMNRANLAKVFGELYFLLEYRRQSIRLQYRPEESFTLPPNLFIIGTMNTADRSIALLDAAMRRRFAFVELHPDEEPVSGVLANYLTANGADDTRARLLDALNAAIADVDRDFKIGPSYLMRPAASTDEGLERIWKHDILPLLEEHHYGRMKRAEVHRKFGLAALRASLVDAPDDEPVVVAVEALDVEGEEPE